MSIAGVFLRPSRPLPDSVYIELVGNLAGGRVPVVMSALTVLVVMAVDLGQPQSRVVLALGTFVIGLLALRYRLIGRAGVRGEAGFTSREDGRWWERAYTRIMVTYAAAAGLMNLFAAAYGDTMTKLVVAVQVFGLCAGQVSRGSARPRLCAGVVLLAALPTSAGFLLHGAVGSDWRETWTVLAIAALTAAYAFASLETIAFNYRTIVANLEAKRQMGSLARIDALTGLANRLALGERLAAEEARVVQGGGRFALHLIDLDGFKAVNDRYGHPAGDALLRQVALRIGDGLRAGDQAFRIGGDEFAIVQTGIASHDEVDLLGRRLVRILAHPFEIEGQRLWIGASDGTACRPDDAPTLDILCQRADVALYRSKRAGKGRVSHWVPVFREVRVA